MFAFVGAAESASISGWGSFEGVTIEAKFIADQQYEALYGRISERHVAAGAKVKSLEHIPQLDNITASPMRIENGFGNPSDIPGLCSEWDPDAISSKSVYHLVVSDRC